MKKKNITILVDDTLQNLMNRFPEVNWSEVCRTGIILYIKRRLNED